MYSVILTVNCSLKLTGKMEVIFLFLNTVSWKGRTVLYSDLGNYIAFVKKMYLMYF